MGEVAPVDSRAWQLTSYAEQFSEYLQRVSAMPVLREIAARSLALLALGLGEHVVDVGCGTGVLLPLLAEGVGPAGEVVGVDQAATFVEQARERVRALPAVRIDVGDAYALPYED